MDTESISIVGRTLFKLAEQVEAECRRVILDLFVRDVEAHVLDCGCADGEFTMRVAERIGTKAIYGIDIVEENIGKARARGIDARQADLNQRLPFDDESFDVICASHCIEHLCDTDTFIKETHRVLKKGGYLVIATPNLAALHHILFLLVGRQPTIAEVSDIALVGTLSPRGTCVDRVGPAHRRIFTFGALRGLLEYYGFKVEKSVGTGYFPLPSLLARVMCLIDKVHSTNIVLKARKLASSP